MFLDPRDFLISLRAKTTSLSLEYRSNLTEGACSYRRRNKENVKSQEKRPTTTTTTTTTTITTTTVITHYTLLPFNSTLSSHRYHRRTILSIIEVSMSESYRSSVGGPVGSQPTTRHYRRLHC
ncbi:hypothetical protein M0802_003918 [Mischocyttarus mexicanus]|nr:hypothetical protein M0802_003918 [Mischocyttarus mexicanus]